jgi:hypothetical protein
MTFQSSPADDLPPHSSEAEQGVLGCVLLKPESALLEARASILRPEDWFYDLRHAAIFRACCDLQDARSPVDLITLQDQLNSRGQLESIGGIPYLSALPDAVPSAANLSYYLGIGGEKADLRKMLRVLTENAARIKENGRPAAELLASVERDVIAVRARRDSFQLEERLFNPMLTPPELRPVFSIHGRPFATPGNLTNVIAQAKSGKTAFITSIIASVMALDGADTLGVESQNPEEKAVLHFDTEQAREDHWHQVNRMLRRGGLRQIPQWLRSYCFTGFDARKARLAVLAAVDNAAQKFPGIHSIHIDGYADLVRDVNDAAECNEFVASFHALAIEHDCPIIGVIHQNPASEKTRGHLGSQLERKAESNLRLEKDGDAIEVWSEKQRRAPIPKGSGPRFKWSDEAAMHVSIETGGEARNSAKAEKLILVRDEMFGSRASMRYSEMISTLKNEMRVTEKTAERRIAEFRQFNLIEKSFANLWTKKDIQ